jgi:hypothetical protein
MEELADRVADTITGLTGRLWNGEARARLAVWLRQTRHRDVAVRWLRYVMEGDVEPSIELALRTPIQDVLLGYDRDRPIAGFAGLLRPWRRRN